MFFGWRKIRIHRKVNGKGCVGTCDFGGSKTSFDKIVEALIKEAQERGEFDNLPGKGKPIDLSTYFDTPEDMRVAQSMLKNAGMTSPEVQLLKDIAELSHVHAALADKQKKAELLKQIRGKQIEFNLKMERQRRNRKQ